MPAICKVSGAHAKARNLQSSWTALGGSKFAKFSERARWLAFLQLFWSARGGSHFARFLERTQMLAICKVPGAHAVPRNLQRSWSALGGSKFAKFLGRTWRVEFLQNFWSARNGSRFAKLLERTRRLAICKVPARWFGFCTIPGAPAGALKLLSSQSARGGSNFAKFPERARWLEFCQVRSQVLLKSPAFRPSPCLPSSPLPVPVIVRSSYPPHPSLTHPPTHPSTPQHACKVFGAHVAEWQPPME